MNVDVLHERLRKLANTNYYQTLYAHSKEGRVALFDNDRDLSHLQVIFLTYLSFYHSIQTDVYLGEVSELVLKDKIYEEAYNYYRNQEAKNRGNKLLVPKTINKSKDQQEIKTEFSWKMLSRKKKSK